MLLDTNVCKITKKIIKNKIFSVFSVIIPSFLSNFAAFLE